MLGLAQRFPLCVLLCAAAGVVWASPAQNYMLYCQGCHGAEAAGVPGKVPALAHALGNYMRIPAGRDYVLRVPGAANSVLSDAELAEVLNWLARKYSADAIKSGVPLFTATEVAARRHDPLVAVLATRREVVRALAAAGTPFAENY